MEKASRDNRLLKIIAPIWCTHTVASHGQEAGARPCPWPLLSCRRGGHRNTEERRAQRSLFIDLGSLELRRPWQVGDRRKAPVSAGHEWWGFRLGRRTAYRCLAAKSCPTLRNPLATACQAPSVHGVSQAGILEWVSISFSRSSQPRDQTWVSCLARQVLYP